MAEHVTQATKIPNGLIDIILISAKDYLHQEANQPPHVRLKRREQRPKGPIYSGTNYASPTPNRQSQTPQFRILVVVVLGTTFSKSPMVSPKRIPTQVIGRSHFVHRQELKSVFDRKICCLGLKMK